MSKATQVFESTGEQVYPCRCGETHRGDYALYTFGHHNCFHDAPLMPLDFGELVCVDCGKVFQVSAKKAAPEGTA